MQNFSRNIAEVRICTAKVAGTFLLHIYGFAWFRKMCNYADFCQNLGGFTEVRIHTGDKNADFRIILLRTF